MRRFIWILVWLGLIYSAYWFIVSQALQGVPDRAAAVLAQDRIDLTVGSVATTGYPSQFTTTMIEPRLSGLDWAWQGPELTLRAPSYYPLAVAVTLPAEQALAVAGQMLQVTSQDLQLEAAVRPTPDLALDSAQVATGPATVASDAGWQMQVARLLLRIDRQDGTDATYDAGVAVAELVLPAAVQTLIDPDGVLGAAGATVDGRAELTFARPLDRNLQGRMPDLDRIILDDVRLDWGPVALTLAGDVAVTDGVPVGEIVAQTRQWQIVLDVLTAAGAIDPRMAGAVTGLAGFMAGADGLLSVPVVFRDGVMLIGPVPVGPAPRLR